MLKRFSNPVQIAALTLALLWTLSSCQSQPQEVQIYITPLQTQAQRHTATQAAQVAHTHIPIPETAILRQDFGELSRTAQDKATTPELPSPLSSSTMTTTMTPTMTPTPSPSPSPTPSPTIKPTEKPTRAVLNPAYRTQQEIVADVDLNCDGLEERVVKTVLYGGDPASDKTEFHGILGIGLKVPAQPDYSQVWEYKCQLMSEWGIPRCSILEIQILATGNCEQFMAINSFNMNGKEIARLTIFRWDGKDQSVILDAPGTGIEVTQDPLVVTTITHRSCLNSTRCNEQKASYTWNGTEFVRE